MRIVCWQTILKKYHTFFFKLEKMLQNLSSAAVVIGALRVNLYPLLKQCRSRSAGLYKSQMSMMHTVFQATSELIIIYSIMQLNWPEMYLALIISMTRMMESST